MLRSQGKGAGAKATRDFGSCRDLSGRRLRHVNQEIAIQKWNEEEGLRAQRKKDGIEDRELPVEETPSGIAGWHLNTPSWAEGFGKKASTRMKRKRKTIMCTSWIQARARATPPPNARRDWGCPRGRNCNYAHGELELRGEELTLYKKEQKEKSLREKDQKREQYVHAIAPAALEADVNDAFLAGLRQRKTLQASQDAIKAELQAKMVFTPGDAKWGGGVSSVAGSWLVPLNGNVHVEQSTAEENATVEGRGSYYEVELLSAGVIQVGWADATFEADEDEGDGVGDHMASWAYDGCRQVKWTGGESAAYGAKWAVGDVVGCSVDIDAGTIEFALNGTSLGVAFTDVHATDATSMHPGGVFPAFSLETNERIRINIGDRSFHYKPTDCTPVLDALVDVGTKAATSLVPTEQAISSNSEEEKTPPPPVHDAAAPEVEAPSLLTDILLDQEPAPSASPRLAISPVQVNMLEDLMTFESIDALKALGMDKLKHELKHRGLKCG
ncbi:hypothetical protein DYB36_012759 [Aphanomyces astaci]|uniref:C3H1-type domain-containing protein n=1 Tax=Aphanomyces astaci TaxID=112090 RepID=A0A397ARK8_APHAT|nr:hypothetical protein DYB36_012759 [Aphanomyces astaci]